MQQYQLQYVAGLQKQGYHGVAWDNFVTVRTTAVLLRVISDSLSVFLFPSSFSVLLFWIMLSLLKHPHGRGPVCLRSTCHPHIMPYTRRDDLPQCFFAADKDNEYKHCGHYNTANQWVELYNSTTDPRFTATVLQWTKAVRDGSHALGMLAVPNYYVAGLDWNSSTRQSVANAVDGVLIEGGFTSIGDPVLGGVQWEGMINFTWHAQLNGVAVYIINEWGEEGKVAPKEMDPAQWPHLSITRSGHAYALASYLIAKGDLCAYTLVCTQCYGYV